MGLNVVFCGIPVLRQSSGNDKFWPTAAIATNSDARINGVTERRFQSQSRTSTESTINRKSSGLMPSHFPGRAGGGAGQPSRGARGRRGPCRVGYPPCLRRGFLAPLAVPTRPPHGHPGSDNRAWWIGPGFRRGHPEKLKTWKPDMFHGVAAPQKPRFPEIQLFTPTTGPRGGRPCTVPPVRRSGRFLHGGVCQRSCRVH